MSGHIDVRIDSMSNQQYRIDIACQICNVRIDIACQIIVM